MFTDVAGNKHIKTFTSTTSQKHCLQTLQILHKTNLWPCCCSWNIKVDGMCMCIILDSCMPLVESVLISFLFLLRVCSLMLSTKGQTVCLVCFECMLLVAMPCFIPVAWPWHFRPLKTPRNSILAQKFREGQFQSDKPPFHFLLLVTGKAHRIRMSRVSANQWPDRLNTVFERNQCELVMTAKSIAHPPDMGISCAHPSEKSDSQFVEREQIPGE